MTTPQNLYALIRICHHFLYPIYVVLLRHCYRYPRAYLSFHLPRTTRISIRVALFLGNIRALNHLVAQAKSLYPYN